MALESRMPTQNTVVGVTDQRWFDFLSNRAVDGRLDEVNFWRPLAQTEFRALSPGEPFFFRLKHPVNAIAGFGFFAHATKLPVRLAWDAFGEGNGDPTFEGFLNRIAEYRRETPGEYVTVTPDLRFEVSRRLRDDYENGRIYYELDGALLRVIPGRGDQRPSRRALEWHASQVFR